MKSPGVLPVQITLKSPLNHPKYIRQSSGQVNTFIAFQSIFGTLHSFPYILLLLAIFIGYLWLKEREYEDYQRCSKGRQVDGRGTVTIGRETWMQRNRRRECIATICQFPIVLAYAVTCHKSQRLTLPAAIVHCSNRKLCQACCMLVFPESRELIVYRSWISTHRSYLSPTLRWFSSVPRALERRAQTWNVVRWRSLRMTVFSALTIGLRVRREVWMVYILKRAKQKQKQKQTNKQRRILSGQNSAGRSLLVRESILFLTTKSHRSRFRLAPGRYQ